MDDTKDEGIDPREAARIRRLKAIVIGLGVAILAALAGVVYGVATQLGGGSRSTPPMAAEIPYPPGAQFITMSVDQGRIYLLYNTADGPLLDVRDARDMARLALIRLRPEGPTPP